MIENRSITMDNSSRYRNILCSLIIINRTVNMNSICTTCTCTVAYAAHKVINDPTIM